MRNRFQLSAIVAVLLVSMIAVPSSSQTNTVLDLTAARTAREQRSERPGENIVDAMPAAFAEAEVIAYVRRSTNDIHVISPDGTGDQVLWAYPGPTFLWAPQDLAWRPDGRELAFSSEHEETCSLYQSDVYAIRYNGAGLRRITNAPACAELATLPKGSVEVNVTNQAGSWALVYVAGAPASRYAEDGTMTFDDVADFGPGVLQPAVGIYGERRTEAYPPLLVTFTNQSRGDYDTCAWTFGDGGTSTICSNPTYTYATKGVYTVALTVSGPGGTHTQTRVQYIRVQDEYLAYLPLVLTGH